MTPADAGGGCGSSRPTLATTMVRLPVTPCKAAPRRPRCKISFLINECFDSLVGVEKFSQLGAEGGQRPQGKTAVCG